MDFSGSCQLHRAEVLGVNGSLREALAHIDEAISGLTSDAPWAVGDAFRVQGDIQSAIGDTDAALAAYQKAYALGWDPEPGHAMLLLERGEAEAAYVALERALAGQSWWTQQRRGMLQAHLAVVAVHAGRPDTARAIIAELSGQAERWPMASIRALTNEATALLARRDGQPEEALRHYHLARQLWTSIDSRPHAARLRLAIAALQIEIGDWRGATTEVRAAATAANDLGSDRLKRDGAKLTQRLRAFESHDMQAERSTAG
jgi:tetratricopeptide (TPR) repeat protein